MRPAILPVLAVSLLALVGRGCADYTPEIWISANRVLPASCNVSVAMATSGAQRARGVLDVYLTQRYLMFPSFQSTLQSSGSVGFQGGGTGGGLSGSNWEGNRVALNRAEIRYDGPDGIGVPLPSVRTISISGTVEPGGIAIAEFEAIPPELGAILAQSPLLQGRGDSYQINIRLRVFGETSAGNKVDSNEFVFPVDICQGCLVFTPTEAIDLSADITPNCRNLDGVGSATEVCESIRGQDEPLDCRLVCPTLTALPGGDPLGVCEPTFL